MDLAPPASLLGWIVLIVEVGLRVIALGIIPGSRRPATGTAWLLLILIEPVIGFAIFLFLGRTKLGATRESRQVQAIEATQRRSDVFEPFDLRSIDPHVASIAELNENLGSLPVVGGNDVELLPDYYATIARMAEAVDAAEHYVHIEFYITTWDAVTDPLFQAMVRATERGVSVKLLFDHLGSRGLPPYKEMLARLDKTKVEYQAMLPIQPLKGRFRRPDLRNHRKILVADGTVAFMGSLNLTERGYNKAKNHKLGREWVELMVRLEGPIAIALNAVFAADWYTETGDVVTVQALGQPAVGGSVACQVVPSGPGRVSENNLRMFTSLIYTAKHRLSLTSPYFVPDESLLYAVTTAAERGVEVELFVSELSDQFMVGHAQSSYYRALLEAGVRIYLYPAPYILHAKHFTVDDNVAVIGSSNMDMRSFALNYEVSMMIPDASVVAQMRGVEDAYRVLSRELTLDEWGQRKPRLKYVDNVMRLTAGLQ
jgi:cardiolipin synthase